MIQTVRISSKNQITLPIALVNSLKLKKGDTLVVKLENNTVTMQKPLDILNSLAGSLKLPKRFKGKSLDEVIEMAKEEHFSKKYAKLLRRH